MRKPSPAMIVALLALFVALGGVGAAATGKNPIADKSHTVPAHSYAASAHVSAGHRQLLFALPGLGKLSAVCTTLNGGQALTRFRSTADGLRVFLDDGDSGFGPDLHEPINRGQVVFDSRSSGGNGKLGAYHYVYSILGKSGSGHVLATINIFATGTLPATIAGTVGGCQFQVSAVLQTT